MSVVHSNITTSRFAREFKSFSPQVQTLIESLDPTQFTVFEHMYSRRRRDRVIVFILSVLFGWFGIDRFYIGDVWFGLIKLLTLGFGGLLWFLDLFLIQFALPRANEAIAFKLIGEVKSVTQGRSA